MTSRQGSPPRRRRRRGGGGGTNPFDVVIALINGLIWLLTFGIASFQESRQGRRQPGQKRGLPGGTKTKGGLKGRGGGPNGTGGPPPSSSGGGSGADNPRQPIYDPYDPDRIDDAEIIDDVPDEDVILEPDPDEDDETYVDPDPLELEPGDGSDDSDSGGDR